MISFAFTQNYKCVVTKVLDENYYEEGLSLEEYPDVMFEEDKTDGKILTVGAMSYRESDGDQIEYKQSANKAVAVVVRPHESPDTILFKLKKDTKGTLLVREGNARNFRKIALLKCN